MTGEGPSDSAASSRASLFLFVLATLAVVLSVAGGAAGYVLGSRAGADLAGARLDGQREGERLAAAQLRPRDLRRAQRAGEKAGRRAAYGPANSAARNREIAAGPQACGDARTSETPVIAKVRAQGIGCAPALNFARQSLRCGNLEQECNGYSCSALSTGWEESEITCRSGERTIRWLTGV